MNAPMALSSSGNGPSRDPVPVGHLMAGILADLLAGSTDGTEQTRAEKVIHAPEAERSLPWPAGRVAQTQGGK